MLPEIFIDDWRKTVSWQLDEQIEQDLIISRALLDLYKALLKPWLGDPQLKITLRSAN